MQVGLHDHREQRLVHPAPPFQQRREERSTCAREIRNSRFPAAVVTVRGPVPVPLPGTGLGALVRIGADNRGQLGF